MAEQALHAYTRARWAADRMDLRRIAGVMLYQHTLGLVGRACDHLYIRYGGDTGQCLTAKPQRRQRLQVVNVPDLTGREALQRQRGLLGMHAAAVIWQISRSSNWRARTVVVCETPGGREPFTAAGVMAVG